MKYRDAIGADIEVGNNIVYSNVSGSLQIGKVLELTTVGLSDYSKGPLPSKKVLTCKQYGCDAQWCTIPDMHSSGRTQYPKKKVPALKIQGARRNWDSDKFTKMNPSFITKFENVLVINSNLAVTMTLI